MTALKFYTRIISRAFVVVVVVVVVVIMILNDTSTFQVLFIVFRLDALALSVIATATWLGVWVAGWLSHSGIVSKPLNVSKNIFDRLKAPSL